MVLISRGLDVLFMDRAVRFSKGRRPLQQHTCRFFRKGDDGGGDTPLPIPNREVKPASADGTAGGTPWESRSSPIFIALNGIWLSES